MNSMFSSARRQDPSGERPVWRVARILAICLAATITGDSRASETDPDGRLFLPSADPLADVEQALGRAAADDRRALVVLGANWCHDSRALASRLRRAPLSELIEQHYELVFVDVGFLDGGRAVTERFGIPIYYATPTVLILDPASGRVINAEDRHQWGDAYNIGMPQTQRYFEHWAEAAPPADPTRVSSGLQPLYAEVDALERRLAERVAAGYEVLGPMLEAYKAGNEPEDFEARWNELRDFRGAIPGDLDSLRNEARRRVDAGEENIQLQWPEYPPLSWEPR